jgi:tight adherence protein C
VLLALLAVAGIFAAVALVVYELLMSAEDRATVRASLRALDDYEVVDVRQRELLVPLSQRVLRPVARSLVAVSRSFMPAGYMESVRRKLILAGQPAQEELDRFRALRTLAVAVVPVVFVAAFVLPLPARTRVPVFGFLAAACFLAPDLALNRRIQERQHAVRVRLPDVLDLLTISVEAGLGFEQALERTVLTVPGPLSEEFLRMLGEMRAGASRSEALRNLDARTDVPELRSFVLALIQADTFGVPIGRILRGQAEEMRVKRRQLAQEEAQKAPVKLLFPTVLCVLPALFVVVIGPAVINIASSLR